MSTTPDCSQLRVFDQGPGACVTVHLTPGSRHAGIRGLHGDALRVAVRQKPERGRANEGMLAYLAEVFGVARGSVELVSGHSSRRKLVRLAGLSASKVRARARDIISQDT